MTSALNSRYIFAILSLALVVRIAAVPAVHRVQYTSDEREYLHMARQILERGEFEDSNGDRAVRAPLFPFLLSGLLFVSNDGLILPHLVGCVLGTLIVALVYVLAMQIWADHRGALCASLIAALYPGLIVYSALLQTETLYIALFLLAFICFYALLRSLRLSLAVLCGVACGLAALTRPVFAGFIPVLLLILLWEQRERLRLALPAAGLMLAASVLTILPWTLRNTALLGSVVPIASGGGSSLLTGNNPYASGTWRAREGFEAWFQRQASERGVPDVSALNESARSTLSAKIAQDYIASHPVGTFLLAAKKTYIFWVYPILHTDSYVPMQAVAVGSDAFLLMACVLGAVGMGFLKTRLLPVWAAVLFFWLVQAVLHSESRFRLPIIPLLAILAGWAMVILWRRARLKVLLRKPARRKVLACALAGVVGLYAVTGALFLSGIVQ